MPTSVPAGGNSTIAVTLAARMPSVHRSQRTGRVSWATSLLHRVGRRAHRLAVGVAQQRGSRFRGGDVGRGGGISVGGRRHEVGVECAGGGQLAHPRLLRRVLGELGQRVEAAGGDDLSGGVAVGRDQLEVLERAEHLGLVAAQHRGHAGRLDGTGLGHLRAAGGGQRDGVVGGDDAGDRVGRDLTDGVSGDDDLRSSVPASRPRLVSSRCASRVAATTRGCVTAVSVISSAVAVVPSATRSRPLMADHEASCSAAPGSSSHGESIPGVCEPWPGASSAITGVVSGT